MMKVTSEHDRLMVDPLPPTLAPADVVRIFRESPGGQPEGFPVAEDVYKPRAVEIVRRYNAFPAMLEALTVATRMCPQCMPHEPYDEVCYDCRTIRAALARASE